MSQFERQIDDNDSICPYCGDRYQVESEDFSEDDKEITCDSCGKKYYQYQSFSVETWTSPDCELNGGPHKYEHDKGTGAFFCSTCGKCTLTAPPEAIGQKG